MMKNWMTGLPGIGMLVIVAINAWQTKTINTDDVLAALAAMGLINAKDWNVTGGTKQQ